MSNRCLTDVDFQILQDCGASSDVGAALADHLLTCSSCQEEYEAFEDDCSLLQRISAAAEQAGIEDPSSYLDEGRPSRASSSVPESIPGYTLLRELQRGGQGIVYEAMQLATNRRVALKVLLEDPYADPTARRQRFAREIELASNLRHPNIVSIFDSGLVEGHFYFAMEFIDGASLSTLIQDRELSSKEVVRLFTRVCDTVAYAHEHGIMHRDIKPSNILVDAKLEPHLLDFGLAARVSWAPTSEHHGPAKFMGTLAYASPEQAVGPAHSIDTRSDVYSLGVVFYQLLTGRSPYPPATKDADLRRHVVESTPPPPSKSGGPADLDLDAIIAKALSKDANERYRSAGAFSDDLNRWLDGDPVIARSASTSYVLQKHIRKYRGPLLAVCMVLLFLAGMVGWHLWSLQIADQQIATAHAAAGQVEQFLEDVLASVRPGEFDDLAIAIGLVDRAAERIASQFAVDQRVEARLQDVVGMAYRKLGEYDKAEALLSSALSARMQLLGDEHSETASSWNHMALLSKDLGRLDDALAYQQRAADHFMQVPHSQLAASNLSDLGSVYHARNEYDQALDAFEQSIAIGHLLWAEPHEELASYIHNRGATLQAIGDYDSAFEHFETALGMYEQVVGEDDPALAASLSSLGSIERLRQNHDSAATYYERSLAIRKLVWGDDHIDYAKGLDDLAGMMLMRGQLHDALLKYQQALAIRVAAYGDHVDVAATRSNLALVLHRLGERELALEQIQLALSWYQVNLGPEHLKTIAALNTQVALQLAAGLVEEALSSAKQVLDRRQQVLGHNHLDVAQAMSTLAAVYHKRGNFEEAADLYERAVVLNRELLGPDHLQVADNLNNLGLVHKKVHNYPAAMSAYQSAVEIYRRESSTHLGLAQCLYNLARLNEQLQRCEAALPLYQEALHIRLSKFDDKHDLIVKTRRAMSNCQ